MEPRLSGGAPLAGHAARLRPLAARPRGPRPLGRHRDRDLLERLHGRRRSRGRAGGGRGPRGRALRRKVRGRFATSLLATLVAAALAASSAQARNLYDVKVLAKVPAPGYPALSYVAPNRTIYVSTFFGPQSGNAPATVFAYKPDGAFLDSYTISGETGSQNGVQVAAMDANGLLYLLDQVPPRIVTLNPVTREQRTYATFKDVPPCVPPDSGGDCGDTVMDNTPEPDYAAWGTDGSLYVTDYIQGLIWRVPPGGGEAHVWFTSPELDGTQFGPAGIVLMPDLHTLMVSTSAGPVVGGTAST